MADNEQTLLTGKVDVIVIIVMVSVTCVVGTLIAMYYLMTMIWCNKKYDITAYQNLLARAAMAQAQAEARAKAEAGSMEESSLVSHLIPAHNYEKKKKNNDDVAEENGKCAVCLEEFEEGEELRTLPGCMHSFHVSCIDMWLYPRSSCPICRVDVTPSPAVIPRLPKFGSGELNVHQSISI